MSKFAKRESNPSFQLLGNRKKIWDDAILCEASERRIWREEKAELKRRTQAEGTVPPIHMIAFLKRNPPTGFSHRREFPWELRWHVNFKIELVLDLSGLGVNPDEAEAPL